MSNILFIPGMMCDARLYQPQIEAFSGHHNLYLASPTKFDSMQALAADILENAPPRFALAGLSMGGILAMEVYAQAPERVERLALLDTNPRAELDEVKAMRGPQMEAVQNGGLEEVMRAVIPRYGSKGQDQARLDRLCLDMALDLGADVFINQSLALRDRPDQQHTMAGADIPTLILCGQEDELCPIERHDRLKELIPHGELVILPGVGHLSTLQDPKATNEALANWLKS